MKTDIDKLMGTKKPERHDPYAPSPQAMELNSLKEKQSIPPHKKDPGFQQIENVFGDFFGFKRDLNEDYLNQH